jgi:hypothetical protein
MFKVFIISALLISLSISTFTEKRTVSHSGRGTRSRNIVRSNYPNLQRHNRGVSRGYSRHHYGRHYRGVSRGYERRHPGHYRQVREHRDQLGVGRRYDWAWLRYNRNWVRNYNHGRGSRWGVRAGMFSEYCSNYSLNGWNLNAYCSNNTGVIAATNFNLSNCLFNNGGLLSTSNVSSGLDIRNCYISGGSVICECQQTCGSYQTCLLGIDKFLFVNNGVLGC